MASWDDKHCSEGLKEDVCKISRHVINENWEFNKEMFNFDDKKIGCFYDLC
mgnify:CR=1 FL=1